MFGLFTDFRVLIIEFIMILYSLSGNERERLWKHCENVLLIDSLGKWNLSGKYM